MKQLLAFTACCVFLVYGCKNKSETTVEAPIRPVMYAIATSGHSTNMNEFSGVSQSGKTSNLSFRVTGNIVKLKAKVGNRVKRGESLATLDPTDYSVQLEQAQANYKSSEVQYQGVKSQANVALSNYKRVEKLYENNSISLNEYEQAKTNYDNLKAQVEAAQAQIEASKAAVDAARNQVAYTNLSAPYDGIIQQVNIDINELAPAGNPIMVISTEGDPEVTVGIPEIYISAIKKGQEVSVSFPVYENQIFKGQITEIGYNSQNTATYPVTVKLNETEDNIRPGLAARVKFDFDPKRLEQTGNPQYPKVPAKAIGEDYNGRFVFLLKEQGDGSVRVARTTVEVGNLTNQGFEVVSGLKGGEKVATAGLKSLIDGSLVRLMEN